MYDLDWDDLRLFSTLAHAGSVRSAAERLNVHASTVARRLASLESGLGAKLFNRNPGGLQLTDIGRETLARVDVLSTHIAELERNVVGRDTELGGVLRISVPDELIHVVNEIAGFANSFPEVELELVSGRERPDPGHAEVDVAIELTDAPPEHLLGREVATHAVAVYGESQYVAMRDFVAAPDSGAWIARHPRQTLHDRIKQQSFPRLPTRVCCHDAALHLAALREGLGIGVLACAAGEMTQGLVRVSEAVPAGSIWLLSHADLRGSTRVQRFTQFIADAFASNENLQSGSQT